MNNDKTIATAMQLAYALRLAATPEEAAAARAALESFLRTALAEQSAAMPEGRTQAARDVLAERQRQVSVEGWTPEHDDEHGEGEMAQAAAVYANPEIWNVFGASRIGWPWDASWYKPRDPRSNYVRAAALLLAEIERLDRAAPAAVQTKGKDDSLSGERTCDIPAVKDAGQAAAGHMQFYREMMGKDSPKPASEHDKRVYGRIADNYFASLATPQTAAPAAQPEPQSAAAGSEPVALPTFIRRPIEEAIDRAVHPSGMSVHDGTMRVASDKVAYLLAAYDRLAAAARLAAPPPAAQSGNDDAKGEVQYKCTVSDNAHPGGIPLEQWQREAAMRGALAKKG